MPRTLPRFQVRVIPRIALTRDPAVTPGTRVPLPLRFAHPNGSTDAFHPTTADVVGSRRA